MPYLDAHLDGGKGEFVTDSLQVKTPRNGRDEDDLDQGCLPRVRPILVTA